MFSVIRSFIALRSRVSHALIALCALTTACSPSMFGSGQAAPAPNQYRRVNAACAGMNLSRSQLDAKTFTQLIECFNSDGALPKLAGLVKATKPADLDAILVLANRYVLQDPKLLYEIEKTHEVLVNRGILDEKLRLLGRLLENGEFVASAVALLRETAFDGHERVSVHPNPDVLQALSLVGKQLTAAHASTAVHVGWTLASAPAFQSLERRLRGPSPRARKLRDITDSLHGLIVDAEDPQRRPVGRRLLKSLSRQELFRALDPLFGGTPDDFRRAVPAFEALMRANLGADGQGTILRGFTHAFRGVNRAIPCMGGAEMIPNGGLFMLEELSRHPTPEAAGFIRRGNLLNLAVTSSFCDTPAEFTSHYDSIRQLAETTAIRPGIELVRDFYNVTPAGYAADSARSPRPLGQLLVDVLSDTGPTGETGLLRLLPAVSELVDRNGFADLLLLANLLQPADRGGLADLLTFLLETHAELGGGGIPKGVYDVLMSALARSSPLSLYRLAHSLERFVDDDAPLLEPALQGLHAAFYANDVHPLVELASRILADAPQQSSVFEALFRVADEPEFAAAIQEVSEMGKDGRLKELIGTTVTIFHRFAVQGQVIVHDTAEPAFSPAAHRRHELTAADLTPFVAQPEPLLAGAATVRGTFVAQAEQACSAIDLGFRLADYANPRFGKQIGNFLSCLNDDGGHQDVVDTLNRMQARRAGPGSPDFLDLTIDLVKKFSLGQPELHYLMENWMASVDDGRFGRLLRAVPQWLSRPQPDGPLVEPALVWARSLVDASVRPAFRRVEQLGAALLRRADLPAALRFVDTAAVEADQVLAKGVQDPPPPVARPYDVARLSRWVENKECASLPADRSARESRKRARVQQMVDDYESAVNSWETVGGQARRSWSRQDLRTMFGPMIHKFSDPAQSLPNKRALQALLNVPRYYSLKRGERAEPGRMYGRADFVRWFQARADDYQPILYYYPGETAPRVRLVNSLDRLELVLINGDYMAPYPLHQNYAIKFLAEIGNAWGDEPPELWPAEVLAQYRRTGQRPATLAQAIQSMTDSIHHLMLVSGLPAAPKCRQTVDPRDPPEVQRAETAEITQFGLGSVVPWSDHLPKLGGDDSLGEMRRMMFNIQQVFPVLTENLPGSTGDATGGLRLLRAFFYELYSSTPSAARSATAGPANNLSVVTTLVRSGLIRETGRKLRDADPRDPSALAFFGALIEAASSPALPTLLQPLIDEAAGDPSGAAGGSVLWKVIDAVCDVIERTVDPAAARNLWNLERSAYYAVAVLGQIQSVPAVLQGLAPAVQDGASRAFIGRHVEDLLTPLQDGRMAEFVRALGGAAGPAALEGRRAVYGLVGQAMADPARTLDLVALARGLLDNPDAQAGWKLFSRRLDYLRAQSEYRDLDLGGLTRPILDFIEEKAAPGNPDATVALSSARQLREYLAARTESGDFEQFLVWAAQDPNGFYQVLNTLGAATERGELEDFSTSCGGP